jgi:integrase
MPSLQLNDRICAALKPDASGARAALSDSHVKGLQLRCTSSGSKSWCFNYLDPISGKSARLTLGEYPMIPLADARARAIELRKLVSEGKDPRNAGAETVGALFEGYIADLEARGKRSARQIRMRYDRAIRPHLAMLAPPELHKRHVNAILDRLSAEGKLREASACLTIIRAAIRRAVSRGDLDRDPLAGLTFKDDSKPRDRSLTDDELVTLWHNLDKLPAKYAAVLKLALLTGCRIGEASGLCREELDLPKGIWNLPAERSKNGYGNAIALSEMAIVLHAHLVPSGRLFDISASVRVSAIVDERREELGIPDLTPHVLRHSFVTICARLGVAPHVYLDDHEPAQHEAGCDMAISAPRLFQGDTRSRRIVCRSLARAPGRRCQDRPYATQRLVSRTFSGEFLSGAESPRSFFAPTFRNPPR